MRSHGLKEGTAGLQGNREALHFGASRFGETSKGFQMSEADALHMGPDLKWAPALTGPWKAKRHSQVPAVHGRTIGTEAPGGRSHRLVLRVLRQLGYASHLTLASHSH